jgi:hypothetical protein
VRVGVERLAVEQHQQVARQVRHQEAEERQTGQPDQDLGADGGREKFQE